MSTIAIETTLKSKRTATQRAGNNKPKSPRNPKSGPVITQSPQAADAPRQTHVTKHGRLVALLNRPDGATIEEMMQATDWQQHSVRGFLAGTVRKKLALALTSSKADGEARRYQIVTRRGR